MDKLEKLKGDLKRFLKENNIRDRIGTKGFMSPRKKEEMDKEIDHIIREFSTRANLDLSKEELKRLREEVVSSIIGFGIIDKLMHDPEITDILVNGPDQIYIEKNGEIKKIDAKFKNQQEVMAVIERMITESGRRIDLSSPFVDFKIEGGARVTAVIPPVSSGSPSFCIRKMFRGNLTFEDLKRFGTVNQKILDFLKYCVKARINILTSGATGVGKTTLMNLLINEFISSDDRIILIEDTEEIAVDDTHHFVRLLTKPPNIEGKGEVTLQDLVKLSLHMRPDRIIVGEVRGEEAFHFLHAINTGHEGSMCTIHANNSEDALNRLETLSLMDRPNINATVIHRFLKTGIDIIIQMSRLPNGQRKISQISEFGYENGAFIVKDIFVLEKSFHGDKEHYEIKLTGHIPSFIDKLKARTGIPDNFFDNKIETTK